ncbi:oleosin 5-like [Rutidosis leptorrhynchoides]|uniref:oleosin 5-like n=1 Tax=Rutidosis leptorrhynchoides TaxID=125765 RepID=UPI003A996654
METQTQFQRPQYENPQYQTHLKQYKHQQISTKTMLFATVVGLTIGGPLLAMMGFSFLATMTLFVVTSPLLLIFSPVIAGALFAVLAALVGFAAAGTMAILGLSALGWVFRTVKTQQLTQGIESAAGKLVDYGENIKENVKDTGKEWGSQLKQTVQNSPDTKTAANKA